MADDQAKAKRPPYDPKDTEARWSNAWSDAGLFHADVASTKPKRAVTLPPPNVTGALHLGHALNSTLQDIWVRYYKMLGYEVHWQPGTDHAAISTQNVIERKLAGEGTTKEKIGREAFDKVVEEWYAAVGATILQQFRDLGQSFDPRDARFTMDEGYVRAVRTAFVQYYDKGMMYRGPRIVNWCPHCVSAISDLEVDWQEHTDVLYFIRYAVDGVEDGIVVATVRPETMLADAAVAVHPDDVRYMSLIGKTAVLPLAGRHLPIVGDSAVRPEFGTGALKVTPAHDPTDYDIGVRHNLEMINGIGEDGLIIAPDLPRYHGKTPLEARALIVSDLEGMGVLVKSEPYVHQVGHCDRCREVIEPLISEQWFLRMSDLAEASLAVSKDGLVQWHPARFEQTYTSWLSGIRDWCVSRQLWLGHRIPVYTCADGHQFASVDEPTSCADTGCASTELTQDPDVLDTWFSSALWPLATLGWPDQVTGESFRTWYPTALIVTARDIINLWVTRMIFSGLEFTGQVPFSDVIVHATVLAPDGTRMSKSKGNGVDPSKMVQKHGADALRAWAATIGMSTQDVRFDESKIEGYSRFANKLWNAVRLVTQNVDKVETGKPTFEQLTLEDRWILSRLQKTIEATTKGIEEFAFQTSITALYDFVWHDFCDWYLEAAKVRLRNEDVTATTTAVYVVEEVVRALHPFMPFVTEELWHRLPGDRDFLVRTEWPRVEVRLLDEQAETEFGTVIQVVEEIRQLRRDSASPDRGGEMSIAGGMSPEVAACVSVLGRVEIVPKVADMSLPLSRVDARVALPSVVITDTQRTARLEKLEREAAYLRARLDDQEFAAKAPAKVVQGLQGKLAETTQALKAMSLE